MVDYVFSFSAFIKQYLGKKNNNNKGTISAKSITDYSITCGIL